MSEKWCEHMDSKKFDAKLIQIFADEMRCEFCPKCGAKRPDEKDELDEMIERNHITVQITDVEQFKSDLRDWRDRAVENAKAVPLDEKIKILSGIIDSKITKTLLENKQDEGKKLWEILRLKFLLRAHAFRCIWDTANR